MVLMKKFKKYIEELMKKYNAEESEEEFDEKVKKIYRRICEKI